MAQVSDEEIDDDGNRYSPIDPEQCVGFIGAGKMAQGLAAGLLAAAFLRHRAIVASAPSTRNLEYFKNTLFTRVTHDNLEVLRRAHVIFIAVKPQYMQTVLDEIKEHVQDHHIIVSIAAGISLKFLEDNLMEGTQVIRAMPNMPVQVRAGVTVYVHGKATADYGTRTFTRLMNRLGICEEVASESVIDAVTGMVGSGSAFVFQMMQALADGGVKMGIPRHLANTFAVQTFLGSSKLVQESKKHPRILLEEVASPGGTTIHGLHELEKGCVSAGIMNAVEAASLRASALGSK